MKPLTSRRNLSDHFAFRLFCSPPFALTIPSGAGLVLGLLGALPVRHRNDPLGIAQDVVAFVGGEDGHRLRNGSCDLFLFSSRKNSSSLLFPVDTL